MAPAASPQQVPDVPKDKDIPCDAGQSGVAPPAPTNQTWALLPDPNLPPTPQIPEFKTHLEECVSTQPVGVKCQLLQQIGVYF